MTQQPSDPRSEKWSLQLRIAVPTEQAIWQEYVGPLAAGGLVVARDLPPAVGGLVRVELVLPGEKVAGWFLGRVVASRPASLPGDKTAGMVLALEDADPRLKAAVARHPASAASQPAAAGGPASPKLRRRESVSAKKPRPPGRVVGIDLGTTNSCVAIVEDGRPQVVVSLEGYETVPSVVFVDEERQVSVGRQAVERMVYAPHRGIVGSKRFIGRPYACKEVRTYGHFFHYELVPGHKGEILAKLDNAILPLEVVAAHILSKLRRTAEQRLGESVARSVITVPAYFGERQRQAVRDAGQVAGLEVERILSEPAAAAVAYGFGRQINCTALVYDLGGGTFDASLLRIHDDKVDVLALGGDAFLGGSDFDDRLTEFVLMTIERSAGIQVRADPVAVQRVRLAAEQAKRELSDAAQVQVRVPNLAQGPSGPYSANVSVDRDFFERITEDLVQRTLTLMQSVLDEAKLPASKVDEVILVGGQSRSPHVRRLLAERFGDRLNRSVHPEHAVALGAALIAAGESGNQTIELTHILPASIRRSLADGRTDVLLPRGTPLPARAAFQVHTQGSEQLSYSAMLLRGEADTAADNEPLGAVELPSNVAQLLSGTAATLDLLIDGDGLMKVSLHCPSSGEVRTLALRLEAPPSVAVPG